MQPVSRIPGWQIDHKKISTALKHIGPRYHAILLQILHKA